VQIPFFLYHISPRVTYYSPRCSRCQPTVLGSLPVLHHHPLSTKCTLPQLVIYHTRVFVLFFVCVPGPRLLPGRHLTLLVIFASQDLLPDTNVFAPF
jgi:hypothetical protein